MSGPGEYLLDLQALEERWQRRIIDAVNEAHRMERVKRVVRERDGIMEEMEIIKVLPEIDGVTIVVR